MECTSNFVPHFKIGVITHPCWDWYQSALIKGPGGGCSNRFNLTSCGNWPTYFIILSYWMVIYVTTNMICTKNCRLINIHILCSATQRWHLCTVTLFCKYITTTLYGRHGGISTFCHFLTLRWCSWIKPSIERNKDPTIAAYDWSPFY